METPIKTEYENSEIDVADQNEGFEVDPEKEHDDLNMLKTKSEACNSSDEVTETNFKERVDTLYLEVDLLDVVKEEPFSGFEVDPEKEHDDWNMLKTKSEACNSSDEVTETNFKERVDTLYLEVDLLNIVKEEPFSDDGIPLEDTNQDSTSDSEDNIPLQNISKQWKPNRLKNKSKVSLKRSNICEIKPILKPAREIILSKEEQLQQMLERSKSLNYQDSLFKCDLCYKGFVDAEAFEKHQEEHEVLHLSKKRKSDNETEKDIQKSQAPLRITEKGEENKAQNEDSRKIPDLRKRSNTFIELVPVNTPIKTITLNIETTTSNINSDRKNSKTEANSNEQVTAPNNIFICDVCKKEYICKSFLETHIKKWHIIGIDKNYKNTKLLKGKDVDILKNNNMTEKKLSKNKNKHKNSTCSDETQYKCNYCKKCFNQSSHLARHVRFHTGEKPYKCNFCTKCFSGSSTLARHLRIHTGEKLYKCSYCTKCFSDSGTLARHVRIHTGEKPYKCSNCTKCFIRRDNLDAHVRIHTGEKLYKCSYCTKCFTTSRELAKHVRIHTGEQPYKCSFCTKCFSGSSTLARHLRIHTGEKLYKCSYCTKCFSDSGTLARHVRIHTGEKPYKCSYCTKCFIRRDNLDAHVRIHTGEKLYKCSYCTKCFTSSSDLARHVRIHTGEKPYKCSYCTKCFNQSSTLAKHVRSHTEEMDVTPL